MERADVLVAGGGLAGACAAVAAAREGAAVLLVERYGFLGGTATAGAVGQFAGWATAGGARVVRGLGHEVVERLQALDAAAGYAWFVMSTGHRMDRVEYDPEMLKVVLDEMVAEAGARVLFHVWVADVARRGRVIDQVRLVTKSGPLDVAFRVMVDATGDLDPLARAGASFLGLEEGESLQPGTLMFRMGPIDFARFDGIEPEAKRELAFQGVEAGALARAALHASRVPGTRDAWFNVTRIAVDGTDAFDLSRAEMEGRRQALRAARFIAARVPGCEEARLVATAPQTGIRETRRVAGDYVLTAEDLRRPSTFPDTVSCGAYPIDIHHARGHGLTIERFGPDHFYRIPYRALVPRDLDNALVAGRGISATHQAHGAVRTMPQAMALGQAAGCAAALAVAGNAPVRAVAADRLQARLRAGGAYIA